MSLRFGTASLAVMRSDLQKIRDRLQARIIKLEGIPSYKKTVEKLKVIDRDFQSADDGLLGLLKSRRLK